VGVAAAIALALALGSFALDGKPVGKTGAAIDARKETLEAVGAAAGDLRAPSAEIGRIRAERTARARAEARLAAALDELKALTDEGERKAKLATAESKVRYGSDGSVEVKLTLSLRGVDIKR
jgi:hypothetical protein